MKFKRTRLPMVITHEIKITRMDFLCKKPVSFFVFGVNWPIFTARIRGLPEVLVSSQVCLSV